MILCDVTTQSEIGMSCPLAFNYPARSPRYIIKHKSLRSADNSEDPPPVVDVIPFVRTRAVRFSFFSSRSGEPYVIGMIVAEPILGGKCVDIFIVNAYLRSCMCSIERHDL